MFVLTAIPSISIAMMRMLRQRNIKESVIAAMFWPLMLFAFFSVGTMPSFSGEGIEIVICSGDTMQTITVDKNGQPIENGTHEACEWSMQIHAVDLPQPLLSTANIEAKDVRLPTHGEAPLLLQNIHHNRKARGPPLV